MEANAINEPWVGVLALACAVAVLVATAFDASAGLGPAAAVDSHQAAPTPAVVRP